MTDEQFITAFEREKIQPADFDHEAHVRLAFLMISAHPLEHAVIRVREGLRALASRAGRPEIYDDALTLGWIERIRLRMREGDDWLTFRSREWEALRTSRP